MSDVLFLYSAKKINKSHFELHVCTLNTCETELSTFRCVGWISNFLEERRLFESSLWCCLDTHGSNTINYQECLVGLSMLMNGNPQERLTLSFELFDVDGTGTTSKQEMLTVLRAADKNATSDTETAKFVEKKYFIVQIRTTVERWRWESFQMLAWSLKIYSWWGNEVEGSV